MAFVVWNEWWFPLFPAVAAGLTIGSHARTAARHLCAATLPLGEQEYRVRTIDPGEGTGRVALLARNCDGVVLTRWPRAERIHAGEVLHVTAHWTPAERWLHRPDGMLLVTRVDSTVSAIPSIAEAMRNSIVRSTHMLYGLRAPLANALLAGWRGELDPELRNAFASAGLMHLLAISGVHIALLAGWVLLLLRLARVPRHPAECAAAIIALTYVASIGWPAAAMRASILFLLGAACRWRQRQVRLDALLGMSVLVVLVADPWSVAEPGLWLSVAGLSGISIALRWSDRAFGPAWWIRSISGSTGAVITTAPIAAAVFGQVAPIGILLNVVGMPLLVALLPALGASVTIFPIAPSIATGFAGSGNALLALLELLARAGSSAPGSAPAGEGGLRAAAPWIGLLLAAAWATWRETTMPEAVRRLAWSAAAALTLLFVIDIRRTGVSSDKALTLLFVDVGQGDAALIRTRLGHWVEIDAGPVGEGRDAGRRVIAPLLAKLGASRIDLFVLSHGHRDHVGGGTGLLDRVSISLALEPGEIFADSAYENWLQALAGHHSRWRAVRAGSHWTIDGVTFRVLHPPSPWQHQGEDLNEDSIVLEVGYGEFRALLMGDAGFVTESALANDLRPVNVLKVGHHGSRTASGSDFLSAIRPQAAIVSVGRNNYGHPSAEALGRLADAGAAVWRTDLQGTVTVVTDGRTFDVKGTRSTATFGTSH